MKQSEIRRCSIADIYVGERLRAVNEEAAGKLAASIEQIGLMTPITIRIMKGPILLEGVEEIDVPTLVAGATRLAAMKLLGREEIECRVLPDDDIDALLWEIDENLARAELSNEEKRAHLKRRKELWEKREETGGKSFPTSLSDGRAAGPQHQKSFAAETAAATGLSKRRINQLLADPKPEKPAKLARGPTNDFEVVQVQLDALNGAWNRAGPEAREKFLAGIDRPVFDMTQAGRAA